MCSAESIIEKKLDAAESIEWFIEALAFLLSYDSTYRPHPSPLSCQHIVFLSQSSCVSPVGLEKAWPSINHSILSGLQVSTAVLDYLYVQYCKLPYSLHFLECVFSWKWNHAGCGCTVRQGSVSSAFKIESISVHCTVVFMGLGQWSTKFQRITYINKLSNP